MDHIWTNGPTSTCPCCSGDAKLVWSGMAVITSPLLFHLYWKCMSCNKMYIANVGSFENDMHIKGLRREDQSCDDYVNG